MAWPDAHFGVLLYSFVSLIQAPQSFISWISSSSWSTFIFRLFVFLSDAAMVLLFPTTRKFWPIKNYLKTNIAILILELARSASKNWEALGGTTREAGAKTPAWALAPSKVLAPSAQAAAGPTPLWQIAAAFTASRSSASAAKALQCYGADWQQHHEPSYQRQRPQSPGSRRLW